LTQAYRAFQHEASPQEPASRGRGLLTDGFDSTTKRLRTLVPGARLGHCLRHAMTQLPGKLTSSGTPVRKALRPQCHSWLHRAQLRKGLRGFVRGQR
jgi:hypothetical protein